MVLPDSCPPLKEGDLKRGDLVEIKNKLIQVGGRYKVCAKAYNDVRDGYRPNE